MRNRELQNQTEKVPYTVSLNIHKLLCSVCLQGLFQTFIGCNYCTQSSVLSFKKIFSSEWIKMASIQGVHANKMPFFWKIFPKKRTHTPNVQNRLLLNIFWFLIFIIYIIYITQQQVLFIMQVQLGKFYSATSNFKCWGSTAVLLVCEYLFTLVKPKGDQSILKSCQESNISQSGFHHLY